GGGCVIELGGGDTAGQIGDGLGVGAEAVEDLGAGFKTLGIDEVLEGVRVHRLRRVVAGDEQGCLCLVVEADGGAVGVLGVVDDLAGGAGECRGVARQR